MDKRSARILVIEDEPQYRLLMRLNLEASGYVVLLAPDARTGLQEVIDELPDLVLLDVRLPDFDGMQLCREIRRFSTVPIIMLTARAEQRDIVEGLNAGADDYVTKPFGIEVLLARIEANLRRRATDHASRDHASDTLAIVQTGCLRIDRSKQRVFVRDAEVELTHIEYRLLEVLARHMGDVVSTSDLLDAVWGRNYDDATRVLHQSIYRVRQKIERDPAQPALLGTRPRKGYILFNLPPE